MNTILLRQSERLANGDYCIGDFRAQHIREVLKAKVGQELRVGILFGQLGTATLVELSPNNVSLRITALHPAPTHPAVDIICATPRPKSLRKVLFTCAMMGVRRLYLIRSARVEKSYLQSPLLSASGHDPIFFDGLSQGGFTTPPQVQVFPLFRPFCEDVLPRIIQEFPTMSKKLVADNQASVSLADLSLPPVAPALIALGPEGGWVPFELELFAQAGMQFVSLGPWILRVETALAVAISQLEVLRRRDG